VNIPYWRWGGAGAGAVLADYADLHYPPYSQRLTNSELVALGLLAMDAFNIGGLKTRPNYGEALLGGSDWAAGMLIAGIARRQMVPPHPVQTQPATPTAINLSKTAGVVTVPAQSATAALEMPIAGS